jgi:uncharacterized RDD family membrane protein YckC
MMFCSRCGATLSSDAAFCTSCGTPVAAAQPATSQPVLAVSAGYAPIGAPLAVPASLMYPYAGFWLRFVAYLIDNIILWIVAAPILILLAVMMGVGAALGHAGDHPEDFFAATGMVAFIFLFIIIFFGGSWLYFALMESSTWQATLGKKAIGLIVTDMQGRRLSFAHATGRFFSKIVTGLVPLAIGYIMAGFTEKKQALHDFIAATLVLKAVS